MILSTTSFCIPWTYILCMVSASLIGASSLWLPLGKGDSSTFLFPLQGQQQWSMPFVEPFSCWPGSVLLRFHSLLGLHPLRVRGLLVGALGWHWMPCFPSILDGLSRMDNTSCISSSSPGGDPGNLCCL